MSSGVQYRQRGGLSWHTSTFPDTTSSQHEERKIRTSDRPVPSGFVEVAVREMLQNVRARGLVGHVWQLVRVWRSTSFPGEWGVKRVEVEATAGSVVRVVTHRRFGFGGSGQCPSRTLEGKPTKYHGDGSKDLSPFSELTAKSNLTARQSLPHRLEHPFPELRGWRNLETRERSANPPQP